MRNSEGQTDERKAGGLPDSERCLLRCQSPPQHQTHSRGPHNNPNQTDSGGEDRRAEGLNITGQGQKHSHITALEPDRRKTYLWFEGNQFEDHFDCKDPREHHVQNVHHIIEQM